MEASVVAKARDQTPGCRSVCHLNNAGCSLPSQRTLEAVTSFLRREAIIGGYEVVEKSGKELSLPYRALAQLLNCSEEEIAIVSSATEAWQQIVYGLAWNWNPGDVVLTTVAEYGSNFIALLQLSKRTGALVSVVPEDYDGDVDLKILEEMLQGDLRRALRTHGVHHGPWQLEHASRLETRCKAPVLLAVTHVPTSSGKVYDAAAIGRLAKKHRVPYLLDACQSIGQMPLDVRELHCDFMTGTSRKYLRGPRGTGILYCRSEALNTFEPATLDNTGATWVTSDSYAMNRTARRFESYEMCFAAKCGLGVAVQECLDMGIEAIWHRIRYLSDALRHLLRQLRGITVQDHGRVLCGIVSFTSDVVCAVDIVLALRQRNINVSVSRRPSTRIEFERRELTDVVRASVHYYTTEGDLHKLVDALQDALNSSGVGDV